MLRCVEALLILGSFYRVWGGGAGMLGLMMVGHKNLHRATEILVDSAHNK